MIDSNGIVSSITLTAAHIDERDSLWHLLPGLKGMVIADKGLIGEEFKQSIKAQTGLQLETPMRSNMEDERSSRFRKWLVSTRRLIETVIGQLAERFHIQKVRARDLWHLTSRINRKILAHTACAFINKLRGEKVLQFERFSVS